MTTHRELARLGLLCAALLCLPQRTAAAEPDPNSVDDAYSALVARAVSAFDAGDYLGSRELLQQAHQLRPNARTLRGMGLAAFEAGRYGLAVLDLEKALAETRQPVDGAQRDEVERVLEEASAMTGRYRLMGQPPASVIQVDGETPLWDAAGFVLLEQGTHELQLKLTSGEVRRWKLEVEGARWVDFDLDPPDPDSSPPAPVAGKSPWGAAHTPTDPATFAAPSGYPPPRPAAYSTRPEDSGEPGADALPQFLAYAAAGGAAIAAGISIWQWTEREAEIETWNSDTCLKGGGTRRDNCERHERAYERAETAAWVTGVTALALSGGAVALFLLGDERDDAGSASAACLPGPAAVSCRVSF